MPGDIDSSQRRLDFSITEGDISLVVQFGEEQLLFLEHMREGPQSWLTQQQLDTYAVKASERCWIFENRYVLSEINHAGLIDKLKSHLNSYQVHEVEYQVAEFGKLIGKMLGEMEERQEVIKFREKEGGQRGVLSILALRSNRDIIEMHIDKLKQFQRDTLIYPMDEYLTKTKLKTQEYDIFLEGMLRHFAKAIKKSISSRLKLYDLSHQLSIKDTRPYNPYKDPKAKFKYGVAFEIVGHPSCYGKFYRFFQNWLMKLNWIILQVSEIACCRRELIEQWIYNKKLIKAILITPKKTKQIRVVVISPKRDKEQLQKLLQTSTRLITGKDFPDGQFQLLHKYRNDFKCYLDSGKGAISGLRIYEDYVMVDCEAFEEEKVRRRISKFMEMYREQEHLVREFNSEFDIKMFTNFYSEMIKSSPITYHMENGQLYRTNSNKIQEQASSEISQIFKVMRKQLVQKPLNKMIPNTQGLFSISKAPKDWQTAECLESRRFKLTNKIDICLRSYGSIQNSQTDGIFIVNDLARCSQLRDILAGEGAISAKFEENLMKNKIMTRPLKYCKYFETITMWVIQKDQFSQRRNSFATTRLKNQIENILKVCGNLMHLKIVLPTESEPQVQIFLPHMLEALLNSCNFGGQGRIELTLYTSCDHGTSLRSEVITQLRKFVYKGQNKVQRISEMELQIEDIEKIIEYSYYQLKFYDKDEVTRSASPLNSYVFHRQFAKKSQTPIFLLSEQQIRQKKLSEYLVCYFDSSIHEVRKGRVYKLKKKYTQIQQLNKVASLLKRYFKQLDYAVVYGSIQEGAFSRKLCYTSNKQQLYKKFEELHFLTKEGKVMCKNNDVRISYEVVQNQFMELYKVETHPKLLDHLEELKRGHSLMS